MSDRVIYPRHCSWRHNEAYEPSRLRKDILPTLPKVTDREVDGQHLPVKSAVLHLCRGQLLREESQRCAADPDRMAPTATADASVVRDRASDGSGWESLMALHKASLEAEKASICASVQRSVDFCVGTETVRAWRGARREAMPGRNRWKKLMHPR